MVGYRIIGMMILAIQLYIGVTYCVGTSLYNLKQAEQIKTKLNILRSMDRPPLVYFPAKMKVKQSFLEEQGISFIQTSQRSQADVVVTRREKGGFLLLSNIQK